MVCGCRLRLGLLGRTRSGSWVGCGLGAVPGQLEEEQKPQICFYLYKTVSKGQLGTVYEFGLGWS
jgi:hypothetical protein